MVINDNRRSARGMAIEDCLSGTVVEFEDNEGFYIIIAPSIEEFLNSNEFEEDTETYSFILNCMTGEFDAIENGTWCYPLNAKIIIE